MADPQAEHPRAKPDEVVMQWLLASDSAIRWQVMRDLMGEPAHVVASERARVASEGWGAHLLARQKPDGAWGDTSSTWHYNVLRGLDYLRAAGVAPDERVAEAVGLVVEQQDRGGRWPLQNPHRDPVGLNMEGGAGTPSYWNTLRALRVLLWYGARDNM
jgi:hypothetical protein